MNKRVLILTDEIAPPAYAPRVVCLCRYLHRRGWHCVVFSDRLPGAPAFNNEDAEWYQTTFYNDRITTRNYIADKVFGRRENTFQRFVEQKVNVSQFDVILCSTCYYFPIQTAERLSRKHHIPYLVDLRDIAEQWGNMPFATTSIGRYTLLSRLLGSIYNAVNISRRNAILRKAKAVVTISTWHQHLLKRYNASTHLIYNGFDENEFTPKNVAVNSFRISYAGKLYDTRIRDPRLMLQSVSELIAEGQMAKKDIEIIFHVDQRAITDLQQLAEQYGVSDICHISGYIAREELLNHMYQSSVLLVLTSPSSPTGTHGMMGTKFYEALGIEKPVLCVRSDEECLAEVIRLTNAGIAASHVDEVKTFLLSKYAEWQQNGYTRQVVNQEAKRLFTRQYESAQFEQLLLNDIINTQ